MASATIQSDLMDSVPHEYDNWRDACIVVHLAYRRVLDAPRSERLRAFAAYFAALDQEEAAAILYADRMRASAPPRRFSKARLTQSRALS